MQEYNKADNVSTKRNLLNIVGIIINLPSILNFLCIYIPVLLSLMNIYEGDPYFILTFFFLCTIIVPVTAIANIVWGICVYVKKKKYGVSFRTYKSAFIVIVVNIVLCSVIAIPFMINFCIYLFA